MNSEIDEPVHVAEYDPQWPELFQVEAVALEKALGNLASGIEHIGSTAVPGLAAKPIIDILIAANHPDTSLALLATRIWEKPASRVGDTYGNVRS